MTLILSIETSSPVCSSALHKEGKLLALRESKIPQTAASQLAVQISELFEESKTATSDLHAVAVSSGPGSYTGLRIGVATAKGICYGRNVPLLSVNSLFVLASQVKVPTPEYLLCPMTDARRMEVYCTILDSSYGTVEQTHARVIDADSYEDHLARKPMLFFGDGAEKCKGVITHPNAHFLDGIRPTASAMGDLALQKFRNGEYEVLAAFEPTYLKDFVAKTKTA